MGGACSRYAVEERWINMKKRDDMQETGKGGRIILKKMYRKDERYGLV
jgi:hypothetical protein